MSTADLLGPARRSIGSRPASDPVQSILRLDGYTAFFETLRSDRGPAICLERGCCLAFFSLAIHFFVTLNAVQVDDAGGFCADPFGCFVRRRCRRASSATVPSPRVSRCRFFPPWSSAKKKTNNPPPVLDLVLRTSTLDSRQSSHLEDGLSHGGWAALSLLGARLFGPGIDYALLSASAASSRLSFSRTGVAPVELFAAVVRRRWLAVGAQVDARRRGGSRPRFSRRPLASTWSARHGVRRAWPATNAGWSGQGRAPPARSSANDSRPGRDE